MALVKGPLFSIEASGKFGPTIVYDKRGIARFKVDPTDPKTAAQGNVRQTMTASQKALSVCGTTTRSLIKTNLALSAKSGANYKTYRWAGYLTSQIIGTNRTNITASITTFNTLTAAEQTVWENEAATLNLLEANLIYASDAAITAGMQLFALTRALHRLNIYTENGPPDGTNATNWAASIAA